MADDLAICAEALELGRRRERAAVKSERISDLGRTIAAGYKIEIWSETRFLQRSLP
jgi:hypothetical protein